MSALNLSAAEFRALAATVSWLRTITHSCPPFAPTRPSPGRRCTTPLLKPFPTWV